MSEYYSPINQPDPMWSVPTSTPMLPTMTPRMQAALTLRVPDSGDPEIDKMIRRARRLDVATAIYALNIGDSPRFIFNWADALIAEEGKA